LAGGEHESFQVVLRYARRVNHTELARPATANAKGTRRHTSGHQPSPPCEFVLIESTFMKPICVFPRELSAAGEHVAARPASGLTVTSNVAFASYLIHGYLIHE